GYAGQTVTVSGWIKLIDPGSTTAKFTINGTTTNSFTQVSDPVPVDETAWVEMTGSYTVPSGDAGLILYVEAAEPTADFLVDDIVVTVSGVPAGPGVVVVSAVDFDDETTVDWPQSGGPTLGYVDADGGKA